jgi:hypothetical protein
MTSERPRSIECPAGCGKRAWPSRKAAKQAARVLYPGAVMRAYLCRSDGVSWHLTSQATATITRYREAGAS